MGGLPSTKARQKATGAPFYSTDAKGGNSFRSKPVGGTSWPSHRPRPSPRVTEMNDDDLQKRALDGIDEDIKDHIERQTQENIEGYGT